MGSITYNHDFPVDREDPVGMDRRRGLSRLVPSLFTERFKSVLYVGANWFGTAFLPEFKRAGYNVTVIEPFPRNCELLTKEHGDLFDSVEQCLVEDFDPPDGRKYDVVFWWHGPEHVEEERLSEVLRRIEGFGNYLVILGCPWGRYDQGANYGNVHERHRSILYPETFVDLGYDRIECLGEVDVPGSNITSIKILDEETGRMEKGAVDESTCWYSKDLHVTAGKKMGLGITTLRSGVVLRELFESIPAEEKTVIDVGCGNAKSNIIVGDRRYTGLDLPHNIETMCEPTYPDLDFIKCDVVKDEIGFISEYDVVLMAGFIDVMQYPLRILDKIFKNCTGYVVIHSQEMIGGKTNAITDPSYNGFTYHSEIGRDDFDALLKKHDISIVKDVDTGMGIWKIKRKKIRRSGRVRSFLLLKNKG